MRKGNGEDIEEREASVWQLSAKHAGLQYVSDEEPGYRRQRQGKGFIYVDPKGKRVTEDRLQARFDALVIPPAWADVWICRSPRGHLQVTGRDERGRKQYIYHPKWDEVRNEAKFSRMVPFAEALPLLRERCEQDLRKRGLPRDKVLATAVSLLDATLIRIGNDAYARENNSYGLTTLRDRHVEFDEGRCIFCFVGKSGKEHCVELTDKRLARIVRDCRDLPGQQLFQYQDESGERHSVSSQDVNAYLREITGEEFTAKDFRTWGGSVRAAVTLYEMGTADTEKAIKKNVTQMIKRVAAQLGNTTAVCRQYYVHPAVVEAYGTGELSRAWERYIKRKPLPYLNEEEKALLHFLKEQL
jgi:DNA topoisomerase I